MQCLLPAPPPRCCLYCLHPRICFFTISLILTHHPGHVYKAVHLFNGFCATTTCRSTSCSSTHRSTLLQSSPESLGGCFPILPRLHHLCCFLHLFCYYPHCQLSPYIIECLYLTFPSGFSRFLKLLSSLFESYASHKWMMFILISLDSHPDLR